MLCLHSELVLPVYEAQGVCLEVPSSTSWVSGKACKFAGFIAAFSVPSATPTDLLV